MKYFLSVYNISYNSHKEPHSRPPTRYSYSRTWAAAPQTAGIWTGTWTWGDVLWLKLYCGLGASENWVADNFVNCARSVLNWFFIVNSYASWILKCNYDTLDEVVSCLNSSIQLIKIVDKHSKLGRNKFISTKYISSVF